MFTGIVEDIGEIISINKVGANKTFSVKSSLTKNLKIDQSLSHNGVCLTIETVYENLYSVTAISETLKRSNLNFLKAGSKINLERAMTINSRLDGHFVQGHVDQIGICTKINNENGSWKFDFKYDKKEKNLTIAKGSITINGVSLTVIDSGINTFSVAIIPHTYKNTTFHQLIKGEIVNLEFDILGKYISKMYQNTN
ncbi:MAG: riboflavin synthase [Flavobacteriaceae bacterium]|nr:riboflavin synthase [Flavobacteriaceae bacterium]|tara:strand:- start:21691 stop:22281 length:591 start_codon:yes stop_codon:yes gene_type:complete